MGKVLIDGELVEFDGPAPATASDACQLIEGFLSGQGRIIASIVLNGQPSTIEDASSSESYDTIEFSTTTPEQQLLDMCHVWNDESQRKLQSLGQLGSSCLRKRWEESRSEVVALLEEFRSLIEGLGILLNYGQETQASWVGSFAVQFENAVGSIDLLVDAVEARSPARLSDALAISMRRGWEDVSSELSGVVIPTLEEGGSNE